jgi:hypothetical protein
MLSQKSLDFVILTFVSLFFVISADLQPVEIENDDVVGAEIKEEKLGSTTTAGPSTSSNLGFIHAFIASFSVIIVSEIGDKTFFIACIMAMVMKNKGDSFYQSINNVNIILEISKTGSFRWSNCSSCPDDNALSSVWNFIH